MTLKPFDIEAAKRGAELITRDGRKARFIAHVPECSQDVRVWVLVEGDACLTSFFESGRLWGDRDDGNDLFMAPKKIKQWVNFFPSGAYYGYTEKRLADRFASSNRIACIEVEFEEGQGL